MRISGYWGEFEAPYVSAILISDTLELERPVEFLVDTGASRTTILDNDAIRLKIDYNRLQRFIPGTAGIGGVVDTFIIPRVRIPFRSEIGYHEEHLRELFILKHTVPKEIEERLRRLPSLLGRDILNKFILLLDRSRKVVKIADESI